MFRNGFKSLREIADYWEYLIRNGNTSGAERSMKSSLNFWKERHNGFNTMDLIIVCIRELEIFIG